MPDLIETPYIIRTEQTPTQARAYLRAEARFVAEFKRFKAASKKTLSPFESVTYQPLQDGRGEFKIVYQANPSQFGIVPHSYINRSM